MLQSSLIERRAAHLEGFGRIHWSCAPRQPEHHAAKVGAWLSLRFQTRHQKLEFRVHPLYQEVKERHSPWLKSATQLHPPEKRPTTLGHLGPQSPTQNPEDTQKPAPSLPADPHRLGLAAKLGVFATPKSPAPMTKCSRVRRTESRRRGADENSTSMSSRISCRSTRAWNATRAMTRTQTLMKSSQAVYRPAKKRTTTFRHQQRSRRESHLQCELHAHLRRKHSLGRHGLRGHHELHGPQECQHCVSLRLFRRGVRLSRDLERRST